MIKKTVTIEINKEYLDYLAKARGDMDTRSEAIMALLRPEEKVLVSSKSFYPEGIFRLPSGGIHPGESPEEAFTRETLEETGLPSVIESKIAEVICCCTCGEESVEITSHIFLGSLTTQPPHPIDTDEQICAYKEVGINELQEIAVQLTHLTGKWQGFGRFRAFPHILVAEYLANLRAL